MSLKRSVALIGSVGWALGCATLSSGCSSGKSAQRYDEVQRGDNDKVEVEIVDSIVKACNLSGSRAYFEYASNELTDSDRRVLQEVAECMKSGALKAPRAVLVTGYTDATGPRADNEELGMERAEAVAGELAAQGVSPSRIYIRSRGERDATGDTPGERAVDRKVELSLVERD